MYMCVCCRKKFCEILQSSSDFCLLPPTALFERPVMLQIQTSCTPFKS